jgi:hypothetical protein
MDSSTAIMFAAVLWMDGVRRVPPGSLVLRRVLAEPWQVVEVVDRAACRPRRLI